MIYQYTRSPAFPDLKSGLPFIEISLYHEGHEVTVPALVDSGATLSVLPYDVGLGLGFVWEEQTVPVTVGGILRGVPAYGVLVQGQIGFLPTVALVFAWVRQTSQEVRTILGQMNFFQEFKITFEGYENAFEIVSRPR